MRAETLRDEFNLKPVFNPKVKVKVEQLQYIIP